MARFRLGYGVSNPRVVLEQTDEFSEMISKEDIEEFGGLVQFLWDIGNFFPSVPRVEVNARVCMHMRVYMRRCMHMRIVRVRMSRCA